MFTPDDTIVAVATPPGRGGLGVVRLSGPQAATIAGILLDRSEPLRARHATVARIVDHTAAVPTAVDQVVATAFPHPGSYTGDDVVEISAHGSPVLLGRIVALACAAGARLAEPGEFTLRAYLNGRLDLVQAEAVADLIDAVTPLQARIAFDQLEGTITAPIRELDSQLFDLIARLDDSGVVGCPLHDDEVVLDSDTAEIELERGQEATDGQWLSELVGVAVQRDAHGVVRVSQVRSSRTLSRRGIPPGRASRRPARSYPSYGQVSPQPWRRRIAPRSNTAGRLLGCALPTAPQAQVGTGALARLGLEPSRR